MKVLHILRSEPDELTRRLIEGMKSAGQGREVALYAGRVDYARLVQDVFESDKVISWWASKPGMPASSR